MSELRFDDVTVRYGRTTAVDGVSLDRPRRPGGRAGRRVRVRQVHAGARRRRAGARSAPGSITLDGQPVPDPGPAPPAADGLPGPLLLARPADDGRRQRRRGDASRAARGQERRAEVARLLELVHLDPALAGSHPARLSGGQRQRVALARALAGRPQVVHRRRDHLGARRLHPGRRAQPGPRAAARARPLDPVHLPQPRGRPLRRVARRGDAPAAGSSSRARPARSSPTRPTTTPASCSPPYPEEGAPPMTRRMRIDDLTDLAVPSQPGAVAGRVAGRLRAPHPGRRRRTATSTSCGRCRPTAARRAG